MKKRTEYLLFAVLIFILASCASTPKEDLTGLKLNPAEKYAIEGVELGSCTWHSSTINDKGEILWDSTCEEEWDGIGWDLRGIDLSQYGGMRIELDKNQNQYMTLHVENPTVDGEWGYDFNEKGICTIWFNGIGRGWGDMKNPDLTEGLLIQFATSARTYSKTAIKSIYLFLEEDMPVISEELTVMGAELGSRSWNATVNGNEITWLKGFEDAHCGWDLIGVDLSSYDRVRIELERNDAPLSIKISDEDWENAYQFTSPLKQNIWEINLSGKGAQYVEGTEGIDLTEGARIYLNSYNNDKPRKKDQKTIIKSIQFLQGGAQKNENLKIGDSEFGSAGLQSWVYDGGIIEWNWNGKDHYPDAGWNVTDENLTDWKKIRVELESTEVPVTIKLRQDGCELWYTESRPGRLEANLDGTGYSWKYPENTTWDPEKPITHICIRAENLKKAGKKTIVKSVTLIGADEANSQPDILKLCGSELGSIRNNAWLDDNFGINWNKTDWAIIGWDVKKVEGSILGIKVTSTDVPLRLRITDTAKGNEATWIDDGTHIFRVRLDSKKQESRKNLLDPEWEKSSRPFDFSEGCRIQLEITDTVYKEGKKTVLEYAVIE